MSQFSAYPLITDLAAADLFLVHQDSTNAEKTVSVETVIDTIVGTRTVYTLSDLVMSSTTLGDVPYLTVDVEAGAKYIINAHLFEVFTSTGGFKVSLTGTATANYVKGAITSNFGTSGGTYISQFSSLATPVSAFTTASGQGGQDFTIFIDVLSSGTILIQAAQYAAVGTSSIQRGSYLTIRKVL